MENNKKMHRWLFQIAVLVWVSLSVPVGCKSQHSSPITPEILQLVPSIPDISLLNPSLQQRLKEANAIVKSDEPTGDAIVELSRLYHANGFLQEAMACYEALIQIEPDVPRWRHLLAFLVSTYGYADDAENLWKSVIELDPNYVPARIRLADVLLKTNRLDESESIYREVSNSDPKNPYALLGLARVAIAREDWAGARQYLEGASFHSNGKIGKDLLVTVYENLGQNALALAIRSESKASGSFIDIPDPWLTDVMQDCYDATQLAYLGGLAAFGGDNWKGIEWFKRALEIEPENASIHFQLAQLYNQMHQVDAAMQHYALCVQYKPDFSDAWLRMVDIQMHRGNMVKADELFYNGFMKCPKSPAYNMEYAIRLVDKGDRKNAITYFKKSIELNPNEAPAYIQLASNYFALNRLEEGQSYLEKALQVEPGNRLAMTTLCFYWINMGDREKASKWLNEIEAHPRIETAEKLNLKLKFREKFD